MPSQSPQPPRLDTLSRLSGNKSLPARLHAPSPITPAVTGIIFPSPVDTAPAKQPPAARPRSLRRVSNFGSSSESRIESFDLPIVPPHLDDSEALDDLWNTLRQEKGLKMDKEKAKVTSLEEQRVLTITNHQPSPSPSPKPPSQRLGSASKTSPSKRSPLRQSPPPATVQSAHTERRTLLEDVVSNQEQPDSFFAASIPPPPATVKKKKSVLSFRTSPEKNYVVAIFDLRGIGRDDIRVTYKQDRIVVSWEEWEVEDFEEEGCLCRRTLERVYHRVIEVAEGVKYRDCYATMKGEDLLLRYPHVGLNGTRSRSA